MRQIKFRAWDKAHFSDGEMVYSDRAEDEDGNVHSSLCFFFGNYAEDIKGRPCKTVELMQFTGLRDKQGKEIYEGDILVEEDTIFEVGIDSNVELRTLGRAEVRWCNESAKFYLKEIDLDKLEDVGDGMAWEDWWDFEHVKNMIVIGNIYENYEHPIKQFLGEK